MTSNINSTDSLKYLEDGKLEFQFKKVQIVPSTPQIHTKMLQPNCAYIRKILSIEHNKKVQFKDKIYDLSIRLGAGDYSNVYLVKDHPEMVVKFYQAHRLTSERRVQSRIQYILKQYHIFAEIDGKIPHLHQAKILNDKTAIEDGFLMVERISDPFPEPSWDINTKFSELSERDIHLLSQVQKMFKFLVDNKIFIDLKRDNVGVEQQIVKLFDWHEEPEEEDELNLHIRKKINSFAIGKDGLINPEIFNALRPAGFDFE